MWTLPSASSLEARAVFQRDSRSRGAHGGDPPHPRAGFKSWRYAQGWWIRVGGGVWIFADLLPCFCLLETNANSGIAGGHCNVKRCSSVSGRNVQRPRRDGLV
jgi:hypothetical protein